MDENDDAGIFVTRFFRLVKFDKVSPYFSLFSKVAEL